MVLESLEDEFKGFAFCGVVRCSENAGLIASEYTVQSKYDGKSFIFFQWSENAPKEYRNETTIVSTLNINHVYDDNESVNDDNESSNGDYANLGFPPEIYQKFIRVLIAKQSRVFTLWENEHPCLLVPVIHNKTSVALIGICCPQFQHSDREILIEVFSKLWSQVIMRKIHEISAIRTHNRELQSLRRQVHETNRIKNAFSRIMEEELDEGFRYKSNAEILKKKLRNVANYLEEQYSGLVFVAPLNCSLNQNLVHSKNSNSESSSESDDEEVESFMLYIFSRTAEQIRSSIMRNSRKPRLSKSNVFKTTLAKKKAMLMRDTSTLQLPTGHFPLHNIMLIPVQCGGQSVALLGFANGRYADEDPTILQSALSDCWSSVLAASFQRVEYQMNRALLKSTLPSLALDKLIDPKGSRGEVIEKLTLLFSDFCGFTELSLKLGATTIATVLNYMFQKFDDLGRVHHIDRVKLIADAYMASTHLSPDTHHETPGPMCHMAIDMQKAVKEFNEDESLPNELQAARGFLKMRVGISYGGPVIALVFGDVTCPDPKLQFDIISPVCNLASRLEHHAPVNGILVCETVHKLCKNEFDFDDGSVIDIKGIGKSIAYSLKGRFSEPELPNLTKISLTHVDNNSSLETPSSPGSNESNGSGRKKKFSTRTLSDKLKNLQQSLTLPKNKTAPEPLDTLATKHR